VPASRASWQETGDMGTKLAIYKGVRYARLLHDYQWMGYKSRTLTPGWPYLPSTPETVPFYVNAGMGEKDDVRLNNSWDKYLLALNGERGYKFISSPPAGWFNLNNAADSIGFAGNVVEVVTTVKQAAQIKTFHFKNQPPSASSWNFQTHPELIHKFTVITPTGEVINPATDIDVFTLVIGRGDLFVPLTRIEFFPTLPARVKVQLTKSFGLDYYQEPSEKSKKLGKFSTMTSITISEYAPRGTDVWGRTDEGWVQLYTYERNSKQIFTTSWKMNTLPAVPES
jgi:hypothetical protein